MNELYARRASQTMMLQQAQRMLPVLWQATQVTKEPLDLRFVKEEFMRVNGHHQQHLLLGAVANQRHHQTHWNQLHSTNAWAESNHAYSVVNHSPLTQRFADIGRMHDSIPNVKLLATNQAVVAEQIARQEGTFFFEVEIKAEDDDSVAEKTPEA